MKFVLASHNKGKLAEMQAVLADLGIEVVMPADLGIYVDVEETGETFAENAALKANAIMEASGLPAIADDSGLCVDALDGAPGVFSARWAGEHGNDDANNDKLERLMADVPDERRGARFHSTVVLVRGDEVLRGDGDCKGVIGHKRRGDHGFGYDPLFLPTDTPGKTMAELTPAEKNAISHRFHALEDLARKL